MNKQKKWSFILVSLLLLCAGCNNNNSKPQTKPAWCDEHNVPEAECSICNSENKAHANIELSA